MKKYEITIERKQRGQVLDTKKIIVESNVKPRIGDGKVLTVDPPIYETVIDVKEINDVQSDNNRA